jgi:two-component system response regulator NreC
MAAQAPGVDRPIDVIIADDHTVVRDGIRAVLEREAGEFRVVAEAADVPSTVKLVRDLKPDLLTLDLTMPGGSSLAALPTCFVAHPTLAVAILTMREDPEYARQALRAGARSYVLKEAEPAELLQAFRLAVEGRNYLHPRLGALIATGEGGSGEASPLSEREREVVRLIAQGHTNPEIAQQLHVAERTVKTYRARAVEKLGFSSRAEITAYARKHGLAD